MFKLKTSVFFKPLIIVLLLIIPGIYANGDTNWQRSLTVKVTNIKSSKGNLKISLQASPKTFGTNAGIESGNNRILKVNIPEAQFVFLKVNKGQYAVMVFQDINDNNKLDLDLFDKPTEPYGFSNNPEVSQRAPSFQESAFTLDTNKTLSIKLVQPYSGSQTTLSK